MNLSKRSQQIFQSEIRAMTKECIKLNGINMAQGVCDLEIPDSVINGAVEAIRAGKNSYSPCEGLAELRSAVADKMGSFYQLDVENKNIIISIGATGAFYTTCLAILNPGDEVIVFEPFYGYHTATLTSLSCPIKFIRLRPPDWSISYTELENAVSKKTKVILINTPANPSGKVFSESDLTKISKVAQKHNLTIISDEIYETFTYEGSHIPPMSVSGLEDRTITISGFSKVFSITGWRIGYAICQPQISQAVAHFNDLVYVCAPTPLQIGVAKGLLALDKEYYLSIQREHLKKRDQFCKVLEKVNLKPYIPSGAYYVLADITNVPGKTDKEKVMQLLKETGIASVPGSSFYNNTPCTNLARFCFAKNQAELDMACKQISKLT